MTRLVIPQELHRNSPHIVAIGPETTGKVLIELACQSLGLQNLTDQRVLDVGCGVRFAQTFLNCEVPVGSYTGVDVHKGLIEYLQEHARDPRFTFVHWNVRNALYNSDAPPMTRDSTIPVASDFDVVWLFSVFTHLAPQDADALLHILRRHIAPWGRLFFSAFIDPSVADFMERDPAQPGLYATYNEDYLRTLIERNGWKVLSSHDKDDRRYIQHYFVCAPV